MESQYNPVMQNEIQHDVSGRSDINPHKAAEIHAEYDPEGFGRRKNSHEELMGAQKIGKTSKPGITPFVIYGFILLGIFFGSLGFWIQGRRKPIFFSLKDSKWMFANPKTNTILWTAIASIIAWITLWVYACTVGLMARKLITKGAKISTIESWVKLSNQGTMFDKRRPWLSLYTVLSALVTAALTVGFAGLLTPISMIKTNELFATELDMTKSDFHDWYADTSNRTVVGCTWWPYKNNVTGFEYMFSTCPYRDDTSMILQSGRAAVEQGLSLKSITKIGDVNFNGTTGGTLPIGRNGFRAFDNLNYFLDEKPFPSVYNYSMLLQGSTVHVTCEKNNTSPISQFIMGTTPTKITSGPEIGPNSIRNYTHTRYDFNSSLTYGRCQYDYNFELMVPEAGNVMTINCPSWPSSSYGPGYYIYVRPFGVYETDRYKKFENLTCRLEPRITLNNVTYSSVTNDFTSRVVEVFDTPAMAPTDGEAVDAIFQIFWYGISIGGNLIADSILSLRHQTGDDAKQDMATSFENLIKGFYEMEMTSLRLYYTASHGPGSRNVTGELTHSRMGYNGAIVALYALVPLICVVLMAFIYLWYGLRAGGELYKFNPTSTTSLLVASSQGGLDLAGRATPLADKYPDDVSVQNVKIKFAELPHGALGLTLDDKYVPPPLKTPSPGGPRARIRAMTSRV